MGESARRIARRAGLAAVWLAAGYYLVFGGEYSYFEVRELRAERDSLAAAVDSLERRADSLEARARKLAEDSFFIERIARERYGFIRDGERLYRFMEVADEGGNAGGTGGGGRGTRE